MQGLREAKADPANLNETWFRRLVGVAVVYRATAKIVKREKFPQIKANIVAYTVATLSWLTGGRLDFEEIWKRQAISKELEDMLVTWTHHVDEKLREHAGPRQASEAAKRPEAWEALKNDAPALTDPLPPELAAQGERLEHTGGRGGGTSRNEALTASDLGLINEARAVPAQVWLEAASWGQRTKAISPALTGIARSMAELALGEWERSPSAKQAKWGLEGIRAFQLREKEGLED